MQLEKSVPIQTLSGLSLLVRAYLAEEQSIRHLYEYEFSIDAFEKAIENRRQHQPNRKVLVDVLKQQYQSFPQFNAPASLTANIELLADERTFTIAAAHQPSLFLGSLYNLLKISGTIVTARLLKEKFPDYHFVPVFWLGSEDHDKEELCHTFVDGAKIEWQTVQTGAVGRFGLEGLREKTEELKQLLHIENHELLNVLGNALSQTENVAQLTQLVATELFKDFGLVVLNPDNVGLKRLYAPIIEDEIFGQRARVKLFPTLQWLHENYSVQAQPRDINFFYLTENSRERIVRTDVGFTTANNSHSFTEEELKNELHEHPERFSPNVFFRPIYQEFILPNLAFVGGGGELSYWLELKPLFDYHNVPYPMLVHRSMAALLKKSQVEKAEKLHLKLPDFFAEKQILIKQWITENSQHELSVEEEKKQLSEIYETLLQKAITIDKTLEGTVKSEQQKVLNALENLHSKITKAEKRNQETSLNQIESIYKKLFPNGTLQERSENAIATAMRLSNEELNELVLAQNPFDKTFRFFSY